MKNIKHSLKPLPPTLKGKKRYVKFEFFSEKSLKEKDVNFALWETFLKLFGEIGVARQKLWLIEFSGKKGIVKCAHSHVEEVKAGILFLKKVGKVSVTPKILKVSGSLKKLRQK